MKNLLTTQELIEMVEEKPRDPHWFLVYKFMDPYPAVFLLRYDTHTDKDITFSYLSNITNTRETSVVPIRTDIYRFVSLQNISNKLYNPIVEHMKKEAA